jgi:DNA adenine methylase
MGRQKIHDKPADRQRAYRRRKKAEKAAIVTLQKMDVRRPALRYHGGKWRAASWIMQFFPRHECYTEAFGGGGSVILQKVPAAHETLNDLDNEVINFFEVLRDQEAQLIRAIKLTPYSRQEQDRAWEPAVDRLERARRFYIRCWQSFASGTSNSDRTGWRFQRSEAGGASAVRSWNNIDHLWAVARRLKEIQIENDHAYQVLKRYDAPATLHYVDPPYVWSTRGRWAGKAYAHEMSDDDHRELAELLHSLAGYVVLSGYESDLYADLYPGWQMQQKSEQTLTGGAVECLWLSPRTVAALEAERKAAQTEVLQMELVG